MEQPEPRDVNLYIYDLTKGLARSLSQALIGKQLDGVWHTSVVVFGREYFFGGGGIESCRPCGTILGQPTQVHRLGSTHVSYSLFLEYLGEMGMSSFSGDQYNLFNHNCNNFSNEVSQFLTGNPIPSHITELPQEVLDTPIGQAMKPLIDALSSNPMGSKDTSSTPLPSVFDAQVSAASHPQPVGQAAVPPSSQAPSQSETQKAPEQKKTEEASNSDEEDDLFLQRLRERRQSRGVTRLCLFKEADSSACVDQIKEHLNPGVLSADELPILDQMKAAFIAPSDSLLDDDWDKSLPPVKPDYFLVIGKLLGGAAQPPSVLTPLLRLLQLAFLREDVNGLLCTSDDRTIIDFVSRYESQPQDVQTETLRMLCNMCSTTQGYGWLTSEREWKASASNGAPTSNSRVVKDLAIALLLSGNNEPCGGAASLIYNFSRYRVSEDSAVDFGSALLQMLSTAEYSEPTTFYGIGALSGLMRNAEVLCLANVMGFNTDRFVGMSDRINQLILDLGMILDEKY